MPKVLELPPEQKYGEYYILFNDSHRSAISTTNDNKATETYILKLADTFKTYKDALNYKERFLSNNLLRLPYYDFYPIKVNSIFELKYYIKYDKQYLFIIKESNYLFSWFEKTDNQYKYSDPIMANQLLSNYKNDLLEYHYNEIMKIKDIKF